STDIMVPELLAALAQVEGAGNPVAQTYWRWRLTQQPFEVYRPASSAVGMYQITDGTFAEARRYCIHDHVVVGGPGAAGACWFTGLYFRVVPSHAVELTSAYLDRHIESTLRRSGLHAVRHRQAERLAAVIHLCGAGAGDAFARRGFRLLAGERCGDQDPRAYVARVEAMRDEFARLAARD
ncbi:MAG: lytic transglycosylase domain-containing protein, partial [Steroidobacteraceae bacterium]